MSVTQFDWGPQALRQQLEPLLPGLNVEVLACVASTNTVLLERARAVYDPAAADFTPCLLVAEDQSGGRGRQGRAWTSARGASLTFSLALPLARGDFSGLSLAVGVALAEALAPAPRVGIKWPNDLWLMDLQGSEGPLPSSLSPSDDGRHAAARRRFQMRGRKLGGVLIETVPMRAARVAVIGVGLNVLPLEVPGASSGFACVREIQPGASAPAVLRSVAPPLVRALRLFEREGFGAFEQRFAARDVLRERVVCTTQPDVPEGMAQGVSSQGALLVRTRAGLHSVASGEVSVRLDTLVAPAPEASC